MAIVTIIPAAVLLFAAFFVPSKRLLLAFFLPCLLMLPGYFFWKVPLLPPITVLDSCLLPVSVAVIGNYVRNWRVSRADVALFVLLFAGSVADFQAHRTTIGIFNIFSGICEVITPYLLGKLVVEKDLFRVPFLRRFCGILAIVSLIGLWEYRMGWNPFTTAIERFYPGEFFSFKTQLRWGFARVSGPFAQSELAGMVLLAGAVFSLWLGWNHPQRQRVVRWLPIGKSNLVILLNCLGLVIAQARGPWVGFALALPLALIGRSKHHLRYLLVIAMIAVPVAGISYAVAQAYVADSVPTTQEQENAQYRARLLVNYTPVAKQGGLWGWGFAVPVIDGQESIDNEYLFLWLHEGAIGVAAFLWLCGEGLLGFFLTAIVARTRRERSFAYAQLGIYAGILLTITTVYLGVQSFVLFFLLTGWSQSLRKPTKEKRPVRDIAWVRPGLAIGALALLFALPAAAGAQTTVVVSDRTLRTDVQHFGINLGGESFYDSGIILRNLLARNPGFEGQEWTTILRCKQVVAGNCTDVDTYSTWPANFIQDASYEVLSGAAAGTRGTVIAQSPAGNGNGVTAVLAPAPEGLAKGDFISVHTVRAIDAAAGWWIQKANGAVVSTNTTDLAPNTTGRQSLRIDTTHPGAKALLEGMVDTTEGRSFVHLNGEHTLSFSAASRNGAATMNIRIARLDQQHGLHTFFTRTIALHKGWQQLSFRFDATEQANAAGPISVAFGLEGSDILLDDVVFEKAASPSNHTAFRDEVVDTLRSLHPGILRYMDSGIGFGSSIANLLAPAGARRPAGYSLHKTESDDAAIGIHDFLDLCVAIHADPWITIPAATDAAGFAALIQALAPCANSFHTIHIELGNEVWNRGAFSGATMEDPKAYATRAAAIFTAARHTPGFNAAKYDLIASGWQAVPWWTEQAAAALKGAANTISVGPYLFSDFQDASSTEAIFNPMLAQPEAMDARPGSLAAQQKHAAGALKLAVYETNLGTAMGSSRITQQNLDATVPSLGAALATAHHMLLLLRDSGMTTQCMFALTEFANGFSTGAPNKLSTPLWGTVVDMGVTNRRRPTFLALEMLNQALLPEMLETHTTGLDPMHNVAFSANDKIALNGMHELDSFSFQQGKDHSLVLFNLSLTQAHTITLGGANAPRGSVRVVSLDGEHVSDNNERATTVIIHSRNEQFDASTRITLAPHTMYVLRWTNTSTPHSNHGSIAR